MARASRERDFLAGLLEISVADVVARRAPLATAPSFVELTAGVSVIGETPVERLGRGSFAFFGNVL